MDGVELLRHVARLEGFHGSLVLISGADERILEAAERLARAHRLQVLGALRKPFDAARLAHLLEQARPARPASAATAPSRHDAEELRAAIAGDELVNDYQPQVLLRTLQVVGVEALVRWQHPREGLLGPDRFVAEAHAHGLGDELARWVLRTALRDARRWRDAGLALRLSVNVSMDNLAQLDYPDEVAAAVAAAGIAGSQLVLEITESQLALDQLALLDIATRLRLKGIGLSIDDFGTGYSSLEQLRDVPFDELKLDRGFVRGVATSAPLRAIAGASLDLARRLGLQSVAEGVEDRSDWDSLLALGCDCAQGYFIGRPMRAEQLDDWIQAWQARRGELAPRGS